jgi:hypothetical protein
MSVKLLSYFFCFTICSCKSYSQLTLNQVKYIGSSYKSSLNKSFVTNQLKFLNKEDTVYINLRLPFDSSNNNIINEGLYYSCKLVTDSSYSFTLKKSNYNAIPNEWNSYYRINAKFLNRKRKSKFREIKKDTEYLYKGNYGKFIDINNELYEIILLSPASNCALQH